MGNLWHGYVLVTAHPDIPQWQWKHVPEGIRGRVVDDIFEPLMDRCHSDPQPARRYHMRIRPDGRAFIAEGVFDVADLNPHSSARLFKYIADVLNAVPVPIIGYEEETGMPIYPEVPTWTPGQIRQLMNDKVQIFVLEGEWAKSGDAARAYLAANIKEWGEKEEIV